MCWVIFDTRPGSGGGWGGGVKMCNLRQKNGGDLRAAGAAQSWKEVTRTWHGGAPTRFHRPHCAPKHHIPLRRGPTAGLARNYGPVIAVCVRVCVMLVYASLGHITEFKKKKNARAVKCIVLHSDG